MKVLKILPIAFFAINFSYAAELTDVERGQYLKEIKQELASKNVTVESLLQRGEGLGGFDFVGEQFGELDFVFAPIRINEFKANFGTKGTAYSTGIEGVNFSKVKSGDLDIDFLSVDLAKFSLGLKDWGSLDFRINYSTQNSTIEEIEAIDEFTNVSKDKKINEKGISYSIGWENTIEDNLYHASYKYFDKGSIKNTTSTVGVEYALGQLPNTDAMYSATLDLVRTSVITNEIKNQSNNAMIGIKFKF